MIVTDTKTIDIEGTPSPPPPSSRPPESKPALVTQDAIVINDKIVYDFDEATIKEESYRLLNEIVGAIKTKPNVKKLYIEDHTYIDGSQKHNRKLSDNRASAVKQYLVDNGIAESMFDSKSVGESKFISDNETHEGKENNRWIMFIILIRMKTEKTYEIDPKTGKNREVKKEIAQ